MAFTVDTTFTERPVETRIGIVPEQPQASDKTEKPISTWKFLPSQNPAPEIFHGRKECVQQAVGMLVNQSQKF